MFYFPCCSFFFSSPDMRRDVQEIFRSTPHEKQVMMFSATLSKDVRPVCKKFMQDVRSSYQNKQHFSYFSQKASSIPPNSTVTTQTVQKVFSKTSQHLYCQPILKCSFSRAPPCYLKHKFDLKALETTFRKLLCDTKLNSQML